AGPSAVRAHRCVSALSSRAHWWVFGPPCVADTQTSGELCGQQLERGAQQRLRAVRLGPFEHTPDSVSRLAPKTRACAEPQTLARSPLPCARRVAPYTCSRLRAGIRASLTGFPRSIFDRGAGRYGGSRTT